MKDSEKNKKQFQNKTTISSVNGNRKNQSYQCGSYNDKTVCTPAPLEFSNTLVPPFYGTGEMLIWDTRKLLDSVNKEQLYKEYWDTGTLELYEDQRIRETEFEQIFNGLSTQILEQSLIDARGFYGYYPVITDNEHLIVLDPGDFHTERASFTFPRLKQKQGRSFSDYFRPEGDLIAFQVVTIGEKISNRSRQYFQQEERHPLGVFIDTIGSCITQQLAEKVTREIRRGLMIPETQGKRFCFGCQELPDSAAQKQVFRIMSIEDRLGIALTEQCRLIPPHSTLGVFAYHPEVQSFS